MIFSVTTAPNSVKSPKGRGTPLSFLLIENVIDRLQVVCFQLGYVLCSLSAALAGAVDFGGQTLTSVRKIDHNVVNVMVGFRGMSDDPDCL